MKMERIVATAGTLILGLSAAAAQAGVVGLDVTIDDLAPDTTVGTMTWSMPDPVGQVHTLDNSITWATADGASFTVDSGLTQWDPDPSLVFSASATNKSSVAKTYKFTFSAPLTPNLLGTITSHAELGVTLTDGNGNGVSLTTPAGALFMLTSFDRYSNDTTVSKNVDIGTDVTSQGLTSFSKDSSLICVQSCKSMYATLSFTLSAGDSVGFSGKITQTAVPLPAAGLLFGSSLLGLAGIGRRRKLAA